MRLRHGYARDIPGQQQKWDYAGRSDGQEVYYGHAPIDAADTDATWVIQYRTYDANQFISTSKCRMGTWSGRVALFS